MLVIRKLEDIGGIKRIDGNVRKWLQGLFQDIVNAYDGDPGNFSLEGAGPIAFLEGPEDCTDLFQLGLRGAYSDTCPELVEWRQLECGDGGKLTVWISTVVRNNSEAVTLCSVAGSLDAATEEFLRENVV